MRNQIPQILYEDNHLIVVDKPEGMPSQDDQSGDESVFVWVKSYLRKQYQKPGNVYLALLHRIDRPVGGIMVLAKTSKAAARLTEQFKQQQIAKTYLALVEGNPDPEEATLLHYLKKKRGHNIVQAYERPVREGKLAELNYTTICREPAHALLAVMPRTGRQHQIRVQLARVGYPISGDVKYGAGEPLEDRSIALISYRMGLEHPVKRVTMWFTASYVHRLRWAKYKDILKAWFDRPQ